jgi:hypothetical protein
VMSTGSSPASPRASSAASTSPAPATSASPYYFQAARYPPALPLGRAPRGSRNPARAGRKRNVVDGRTSFGCR